MKTNIKNKNKTTAERSVIHPTYYKKAGEKQTKSIEQFLTFLFSLALLCIPIIYAIVLRRVSFTFLVSILQSSI